MEAYLQTEDLAVGYQGRTLIGEISLAVQRGRIVISPGPPGGHYPGDYRGGRRSQERPLMGRRTQRKVCGAIAGA